MSSHDRKKARERYLLKRFLSVANIDAQIEDGIEPPDFKISLSSGISVGVEVTEIFVNTPEGQVPHQAKESLTEKLVNAARGFYEQLGGRHVHVNVLFFDGIDVRTLHRDTVAKALANLVMRLPLKMEEHTQWRNDYEDNTLDFIAYVTAILVPEKKMAHWSVTRVGWVAEVPTKTIEDRVQEKSRSVEKYRSLYKETWLLIAIEGGKPSQAFDLENLPNMSHIQSAFDATYFFSSAASKVLRIGRH